MDQQRGLRRLCFMLMIDAVVIAACGIFFFIGKLLFFSSADGSDDKGVFLPVIMYHSIRGGSPAEYAVTPQQAEDDLRWLSSHGYETVSAEELYAYTEGKGELPEKPVMITLDDGFYNNLSEFLPLLEKYDMCAVVSVVGKYTESLAPADPHIPAYSYLTWEDIRRLADSGRVEIGNHTYDMHSIRGRRNGCARMSGESPEEYAAALAEDVGLLQSELKENCGIEPIVFAYPYGSVCRESLPVLREAGILLTLNCFERPNYITRDPDCLYGIFRYNRSGLVSTEKYMERIMSC